MAITVTGRGTSVTPALKDYVDEKIGRALEVFDRATMDAEVILRAEKNPANPKSAVCEVTVRAIGAVIRVAEADTDMYAAIDIASDKVTRQLRKYKTKVVDRRGEKTIRKVEAPLDELPDFIPEDEEDDLLVRTKEIEMEPMTEEHALVQTDLLGHDFYVYFDQDTHQIQVIYHRKNGGYGIIKPVVKA
ncbi:MAG: ribosome hibernation-promoting factor, HPF/YfiA family [Coriobacteriales bacterium]|jgi:putative sigma-54 modulation protein|nr:ribosome-associated translation inhibitor RaiA [Coriobacteriaceae bacterium]